MLLSVYCCEFCFRLLLRREQVHKVVLNQRITSDLELQPMNTSDKAWVWAGMNYSEDETKLEQLAVKFKNTELAQAFKKCIDETVLKVRKTISVHYRVLICLNLGC